VGSIVRTLWLLVLFSVSAPALAQEFATSPQDAAADEVIVPGRRPATLRVEIERLEAAVYDRFNALNGDDELDSIASSRRRRARTFLCARARRSS
jgi:hypothetical protein